MSYYYNIRFLAEYTVLCPAKTLVPRVNKAVFHKAFTKADIREHDADNAVNWIQWYIENFPEHYGSSRSHVISAMFSSTYKETIMFPRTLIVRSATELPQITVRNSAAITTVSHKDLVVAQYRVTITHFQIMKIDLEIADHHVSMNPHWMLDLTYLVNREVKAVKTAISEIPKKSTT
ncbi:TPA_asm: M [Trifolium betacytorhabdovirus 1]|nr:TPA_asm: M [Trifolium betacytorhabdovirus 1]